MSWQRIAFILLICYGAYHHWKLREVPHGPGVLAAESPIQASASSSGLVYHGYQITPLAAFSIKARVLSAQHYTFGRESDLSPVDLALGWGRMSDGTVLSHIDISQSGRFYFWHVEEFPIPREEIETHSANMHMVPATYAIAKQLDSIRPGQIVSFSGQLIEAKASDGWTWRSSLTRNDTGAGACELVYVTALSVK